MGAMTTDDRADAIQREIWAALSASGAATHPVAGAPGGDDVALALAREQLEARIAENPGAWGADALLRACRLLSDVDALQADREAHAVRRRLRELERVQDAVDALRALPAPDAIDRAPVELCRSCSFGRGMISSVIGSMWLPRRLHIEQNSDEHAEEFRAFVESARIPLSHTLLETDLVRRRMAALVTAPLDDGRTFKAIVRASHSSSYVVAPITSRGRAIGFLHADRRDGDQPVTDIDRDRIAAFASCFGLIYEQSVLRTRLKDQLERSRGTFAAAESTLETLERSRLELDEAVLAAAEAAEADARSRISSESSAMPRIASVLTAREREVLGLMAEGATNTRIAEQLVIAEGTVKSHVKHILRKLHAPTRAAAVARYAHLSQRTEQHA
ncbi:LuxR C-terminal-related transcriptional regulator [Patulibacter sp. NPDC049589]|uniref:helix-turn-helix transcriptional regulator n=1 Tax=Patulibacter sp. NPDC049589 TaxID=3154731 RepID=UPI00343162CC